jgi:methionine-rich copper-binding protein CopC
MVMMKTILLAILVGLLSFGEAAAHAHLVKAVPPVGGVTATVAEVRLTFSEAVEAKFSTIQLADAAGHLLAAPPASVDREDAHILVLALPESLAPGEYKLTWSVVSVDTHRTGGSFVFSVHP